jgi:hypothetical protein
MNRTERVDQMNQRVIRKTERLSAETGRAQVETLAVIAMASPFFEHVEPRSFKQIL